jgi:phosphoribosyl-dephospho-CoA transferase
MGWRLTDAANTPTNVKWGKPLNTDTSGDSHAYQAHDLLRLRALPPAADQPTWLSDAFAEAPFAVVRRAVAPPGFVAAGFRGSTRSHRYGALVPCDAILSAASPETLLLRRASAERATLKAFAALQQIVERRCMDSLVWGPTGSVGFELATATATVTEASDLDLLIRTPLRLTHSYARSVRERLTSVEHDFALRIDAQLETPAGGVALSEWAEGKPRVMARCVDGPRLIEDPWASVDARPKDNR